MMYNFQCSFSTIRMLSWYICNACYKLCPSTLSKWSIVCSNSSVWNKELFQPGDLACGTLFQSSCVIQISPTDCSDNSWRDTFFGNYEHGALWLLICSTSEMTYTVSGGALNSTQTIGKHLLTYLGPIVLGSCLPLHKWLSIKFTTALDISKKRKLKKETK